MFLLRFLLALLGKGNPKSITDEQAVQKYIETQRSFYFDLIYERYAPKIFAKSLTLMNEEALAQDCTQEIMMKLLLNLSKFNFQSKFSTWVYSITYNYCIDKIRKRKKDPSMAVSDFAYYDREDDQIEDRRLKEVRLDSSEMIDKSESAVKMKIKRAKEKFVMIHNNHYDALEL